MKQTGIIDIKINEKIRQILILLSVLSLSFLFLFSLNQKIYSEGEEESQGREENAEQNENDNSVVVDNGIPVVYLNIDETDTTIEEMNASVDHSVYCYGTISIKVPEGFHYSDYPDTDLESLEDVAMSIRGRGNSSWRGASKKPYKIKLDDKKQVLGMAENKHWALIANAKDPTLLRDRITGWLGDEMGFAFTPRGVPVDLIMKGQYYGEKYLGSYYLSEVVRVDKNRIEIEELKEGDSDPDVITGGYLVQNGMQVRDGSPDRFYTTRGANWATETPSFDTQASFLYDSSDDEPGLLNDAYDNPVQQKYIQDYVQKIEDVIYNGTTEYRELMDVDTAAKYWLVNEVSKNSDAFSTGSTYIYKDRDPEGGVAKLYWGPLWDFDYAWNFQPNTTGLDCGHLWFKPLFLDKTEGGFVEAIYRNWNKMRPALVKLIEENGVIDKYRDETRSSADNDHEVWKADQEFDYDETVEELKAWISDRIAWLDENIGIIEDLCHKVTFMADGKVYAYGYYEEVDVVTGKEPYPDVEGMTFMGWLDEDGNIITSNIKVNKDMTIIAKYVSDDTMSHAKDIAFNKDSDVINYSSFRKVYQIPYTLIPEDADDQNIRWTSSDINIATVNEEGTVYYTNPGTVKLTGSLRLGSTRTFTLTILPSGSSLPGPKKIYPESKKIKLKVNEQSPFMIRTDPDPSKINEYEYSSENDEIASIDENGVITAHKPGQVKVYVKIKAVNQEYEEYYLDTYTTVSVSSIDPGPSPAPKPAPEKKSSPKEYRLPLTGIE